MPNTTPAVDYLALLAESLIANVHQYQEFWVLAALTDRSYEEGDRNHGFAQSIRFFEGAGVPAAVLARMRLGINGNLAQLCAGKLPSGHRVERNKWKGQDLRFFDANGGEGARVEVKPLFDLTLNKHYWTTAADYEKLVAVRREGFRGRLLLAVYFIQLPNYCYGTGRWYGKHCPLRRDQYPGTWGITKQYRRLRDALPIAPTWPDGTDEPHREALRWPGEWENVEAWFRTIYEPDGKWDIDGHCLDDAAIGMALWECP